VEARQEKVSGEAAGKVTELVPIVAEPKPVKKYNFGEPPKKGERRGGRGKGVPNRPSKELANYLKKWKIDPIKELKVALDNEGLAPNDRASIALRLLEFIYPKRKAVEMTGLDGDDVRFTINVVATCGTDDTC
jgi:hypothetical protein